MNSLNSNARTHTNIYTYMYTNKHQGECKVINSIKLNYMCMYIIWFVAIDGGIYLMCIHDIIACTRTNECRAAI